MRFEWSASQVSHSTTKVLQNKKTDDHTTQFDDQVITCIHRIYACLKLNMVHVHAQRMKDGAIFKPLVGST